jgi:hypothetical protein
MCASVRECLLSYLVAGDTDAGPEDPSTGQTVVRITQWFLPLGRS